jgi:DNA-binding MarR family transcriptional regulator
MSADDTTGSGVAGGHVEVASHGPVEVASHGPVEVASHGPVEVASHLRLAVARLHRLLRQNDGTDLSASMVSALVTIARDGPLTLGDLAAAEQVAPPSVTKIANKLVDAGLARRRTDETDRRVCWIELTDAGRRHLAESRERRTTWLAARLDGFGDDDLECLQRAAEIIERVVAREVAMQG